MNILEWIFEFYFQDGFIRMVSVAAAACVYTACGEGLDICGYIRLQPVQRNFWRMESSADLVSVLVPTPMLPLSTGANRLSSAFAAEESSSIIMIPF